MKLQSVQNYQKTNFCGGQPEDFLRLFGKSMQEARDIARELSNPSDKSFTYNRAVGAMNAYLGEIVEFPQALRNFFTNAKEHLHKRVLFSGSSVTLPEILQGIFKHSDQGEKSNAFREFLLSFDKRAKSIGIDIPVYDSFMNDVMKPHS